MERTRPHSSTRTQGGLTSHQLFTVHIPEAARDCPGFAGLLICSRSALSTQRAKVDLNHPHARVSDPFITHGSC